MSDEELIDGAYKLVMCIATGGSSQVWEVIEQASGRHLAMKLLKTDTPEFKENKASLKYESEVLKTLDHPLIIKFEKFSSSRDNTYLTMEHFRAANVKLQIKANISSVHVRARRLFEGICQAMSHVHSKGWIHRDVKPDNVLMNKVGEIRLVDFSLSSKEVKGFSKMIGGGRLKTIQGTRTYIAPETIRKQAPTFQTDLYSLGILFYEVLTGKTPFQAPTPEELLRKHLSTLPPNPSEFNPNVTPEMDRLIARLLKKKPAERHSSVDEVLSELKRIKIFKEDVTDESLAQQAAEKEGSAMSQLTDIRLDSRADAKLKEMLAADPALARQYAQDLHDKKEKKQAVEDERKAKILKSAKTPKPTAPPAAPPQQPQQMSFQPMPQMPPGYPAGYAPYPQMQMPGMPPMGGPQGAMPGYPNQPMPQQPMQPLPFQPMPGAPMNSGQPALGSPQIAATVPMPTMPVAAANPMAGKVPAGAMPSNPGAASTSPNPAMIAAAGTLPVAGRVPVPTTTTVTANVAAPRPVAAPVIKSPSAPTASAPPVNNPAPLKAQPPVVVPPKPTATPAPAEDLEFMTELPDIL